VGAACWYCHWAQRLQASEASGGCYCGHRMTTGRKTRRCGAVAAWAAGSAYRCSLADLEARTGTSPVGGSGLQGPLYEDGGGDVWGSTVEESATN
jgi:hypothetical protein